MGDLYQTDPWAGTADDGSSWGVVVDADSDGFVSLDAVSAESELVTGYLRTYVYSREPRAAAFSVGAATWMLFKVNGEVMVDGSWTGAWLHGPSPAPDETAFTAELQAGWNRLDVLVTGSWAEGFGCWPRMSDPGDLAIDAATAVPTRVPEPSGEALLPEPPLEGLYHEVLQQSEDVYRFIHW